MILAVWACLCLAAGAQQVPLGLDAYLPVPPENPFTREKAALGRRLFFDRRLSRDRSLSCASCHHPDRAFTDGRTVAVGVFGRTGHRNAPTLVNRGYGSAFFWDARARTLEEQVLQPIQDPNEMDLPLAEATSRVGLTASDLSHALATYVRSLLSGNAPFDRFVTGDRTALTGEEQRGLEIFRGRGNCTACHIGPNFSDERVHNTGIAWQAGQFADPGAGNGAFKTPTLRDVVLTAPYMHDGSLPTLKDVIDFYDRGGNRNPFLDVEVRPIGLTTEEKRALMAFLGALSGREPTS